MRVNAKSEAARLELIDRIHDLRADPDASLDALTSMASLTCNQPMALVSLVEEARQVFISRHGLELTETPREVSFCAKAIVACTNEEIFEVGDTHLDPRFRNNDLVVNDPRLRFYAGVPLEPAEGLPVGTLCVLGTKPAELTPIQRHELIRLAHIAEQLIRLQLLSDAERELRNRLEESEHRLRAAYDKRSHAGRTIAHDLATPLAAIRMTAESLRLQQPPQPLLRQIDNLVAYARNAESLVRDLRIVNSIDGNDKPQLTLEPQSTAALVERSVVQLLGIGGLDSIELDLVEANSTVDEHAFARIVTNLLANALTHNPPGTHVSVHTRLEDDLLIIDVADTGVGIPPHDRLRMLEPYEAIDEVGSGLGLAIVNNLVIAHGGDISIEGNDPAGTVVSIRLPADHSAVTVEV